VDIKLSLGKGKKCGQVISISPIGMRRITLFKLDIIKKWGEYRLLGYGHKKK
jgi:hypothetical protein